MSNDERADNGAWPLMDMPEPPDMDEPPSLLDCCKMWLEQEEFRAGKRKRGWDLDFLYKVTAAAVEQAERDESDQMHRENNPHYFQPEDRCLDEGAEDWEQQAIQELDEEDWR